MESVFEEEYSSAVLPDLNGDDMGEPDTHLLIQSEEDNDLDALENQNHHTASELSDDPVRLYLREI